MNGFATPSAPRSAIEDMIVARRDARPAPAGPDIARVEEERTGRLGLPLIVAGDLGEDRESVVQRTRWSVRVESCGRTFIEKETNSWRSRERTSVYIQELPVV